MPSEPRSCRTSSLVRNDLVASHMPRLWRALLPSSDEKRSRVRTRLLSGWHRGVCSVTEPGGSRNLHHRLRSGLPCCARHCSARCGAAIVRLEFSCEVRPQGAGTQRGASAATALHEPGRGALRVRPNPSLKRSANGRPPGPVCGALHSPQPGPGALPLSPA